MAKIRKIGTKANGQDLWVFHCPGCGNSHPYEVPRWTWNGSVDRPTFSPSLLCNESMPEHRCHLFVRDGRIEFCSDCHHGLAGKTVDMVDVDHEGYAQ